MRGCDRAGAEHRAARRFDTHRQPEGLNLRAVEVFREATLPEQRRLGMHPIDGRPLLGPELQALSTDRTE
jgi:hypothetical protein